MPWGGTRNYGHFVLLDCSPSLAGLRSIARNEIWWAFHDVSAADRAAARSFELPWGFVVTSLKWKDDVQRCVEDIMWSNAMDHYPHCPI